MNVSQKVSSSLPHNLYHITTLEKLDKIKEAKVLKAMPDTLTNGMVKGVFMFDLKNFVQQWTKDKHMNLARLILDYIAKGKELVMLRIPLDKLPQEITKNIRLREVNKAIDWKFSYGQYSGKSPKEVLGYTHTEMSDKLNKEALELVVPQDVPFENIECLGTSQYGVKCSLSDILMGFFEKQPEEKFIRDNFDTLI